jgi:hypothetical protein
MRRWKDDYLHECESISISIQDLHVHNAMLHRIEGSESRVEMCFSSMIKKSVKA